MTSEINKFKNASGSWYTRALFLEERLEEDTNKVLFTLKNESYLGYPSLKSLYLSCLDQSEYSFSVSFLGGWDHWSKIRESSWFLPYLKNFRSELSAKLQSMAEAKLVSLVGLEGPTAFAAAKYLLERSEKAMGAGKRGRPRNGSDHQEELAERASQQVLADYERLRKIQ